MISFLRRLLALAVIVALIGIVGHYVDVPMVMMVKR